MPRVTLLFAVANPRVQQDLVREFTVHRDVLVEAVDLDGRPAVRVETIDAAPAIWDVRATVAMFDDLATEVDDQEAPG